MIHSTDIFDKWIARLKDTVSKRKILARLARVENGNFGDYKRINENLYELRLFFGQGFRIYYTLQNDRIVLLLAGGDKSSQQNDIQKAKHLLELMEHDK